MITAPPVENLSDVVPEAAPDTALSHSDVDLRTVASNTHAVGYLSQYKPLK